MRLIDADALFKMVERSRNVNTHEKEEFRRAHEYEHSHFLHLITEQPTIDSVPVVRCRECIHRPSVSDHDEIGGFKYEFPDDRCPCKCVDRWYSWMPDDNWFCGNGEHREDGIRATGSDIGDTAQDVLLPAT